MGIAHKILIFMWKICAAQRSNLVNHFFFSRDFRRTIFKKLLLSNRKIVFFCACLLALYKSFIFFFFFFVARCSIIDVYVYFWLVKTKRHLAFSLTDRKRVAAKINVCHSWRTNFGFKWHVTTWIFVSKSLTIKFYYLKIILDYENGKKVHFTAMHIVW